MKCEPGSCPLFIISIIFFKYRKLAVLTAINCFSMFYSYNPWMCSTLLFKVYLQVVNTDDIPAELCVCGASVNQVMNLGLNYHWTQMASPQMFGLWVQQATRSPCPHLHHHPMYCPGSLGLAMAGSKGNSIGHLCGWSGQYSTKQHLQPNQEFWC